MTSPIKYLVFDLETGGLDPQLCGITELSAIVMAVDPGWANAREVCHVSSLVRPSPSLVYAEQALAIQGRSLEQLADAPPLDEVIEDVRRMVVQHWGAEKRCSPWAHNAPFDMSFMWAATSRLGIAMPFNGQAIDSASLFRALRWAGHHDCYSAKLDDLCRTLGVALPDDMRHHARGDALATGLCIAQMMRQIVAPA